MTLKALSCTPPKTPAGHPCVPGGPRRWEKADGTSLHKGHTPTLRRARDRSPAWGRSFGEGDSAAGSQVVLCCVTSGRVGTSLSLSVLKACSPPRAAGGMDQAEMSPGRGVWTMGQMEAGVCKASETREVELDSSSPWISILSTSIPVGGRLSLGEHLSAPFTREKSVFR